MNRGKVYLHVGLQKTASTFLQKELFPYMAGVSYVGRPYTQENDAFNSLQYADDSLYSYDALAKEIELIKKNIGNAPLLISDEMFSGYPLYGMINRGIIAHRLGALIPEAEVILFLRGQADLIESLYNQYVKIGFFSNDLDDSFLYKHGSGFSYQAWHDGKREWTYQNRRFRHLSLFSGSHFLYSKLLSLYESCFSKVHIFLYEDFKYNPEENLARLEHILSAKIPQPLQGKKNTVNPSLNEEKLRLRIIQNRLSSVFPDRLAQKYFRRFSAKPTSSFINLQSKEERRNYVIDLLQSAGVFEDNKTLNNSRKLGMEKFAGNYFADVAS
uniref:Sulfotransferase domain-containing protein n=1 Tax=Candidatus Kentrum sp. DK TaxID=2126562 RepID=A0A450T620_9GAMM|nr:MAG: hypothetical protein BECKDK2373C_GA0170839_10957 [Candidatus Kentron sp. DK]